MTTAAHVLTSRSPMLDALERELDPEADWGSVLYGDQEPQGRALHGVPRRIWNRALGQPLRDFLQRPGKEFRGELTEIFFRIGGRKDASPPNLPLVVEALHAGSLIIDDIEDESQERRGQPALHLIHGVPLALNAGNWLYFWASSLLDELALPAETRIFAQSLTTRALLDCHYGQALDLSVRVSELSQSEVPSVVHAATELKTGSLLGLAAGLGALVGGASRATVGASIRFGRDLGTALQMLDDLSGIVAVRRAHKGHEDLTHDRPSWPWAWLAESLDALSYERLRAQGRDVRAGGDATLLAGEIKSLLGPVAKRRIHEHVELAQNRLAAVLPAGAALAALRRELERLEKSYV